MSAALHTLKRMTKRAYRRVGRGQSSTRGKTSGRGGKGQTARAGNKRRPELRDIIKKLPKLRGHGKNRARSVNAEAKKAIAVPLEALETVFDAGTEITPKLLVESGVVKMRGDKQPLIKILGTGTVSKKFSIKGCAVSATAKVAIEKAGGTVA